MLEYLTGNIFIYFERGHFEEHFPWRSSRRKEAPVQPSAIVRSYGVQRNVCQCRKAEDT